MQASIRRNPGAWRAVLAALLVVAAASVAPPIAAAATAPKKTVTYRTALSIDSTLTAGSYTGKGVAKADVVLRPVGSGTDPTAWDGTGPITVENEAYSGVPLCTLTKPPTTGTLHVAIVKSGGRIEVTWAAEINVPGVSVICQGGVRLADTGSVQPFLLTEPRTFTLADAGGSQTITGGMSAMKNDGTMTVTRREECDPKVTEVTTYPPGQPTQLASQAGHGLGVGEKLTADVNVELKFADGSITRIAKGGALKQDDQCGAFTDRSRSFKGTLLLGKIWSKVTDAFGGTGPNWQAGSVGGGVRGTTYLVDTNASRTILSVAKGSVWVRRLSRGRLVGPKVVVKAGYIATARRGRAIVVRRARSPIRPMFGAA
jgi:hypothetical protein